MLLLSYKQIKMLKQCVVNDTKTLYDQSFCDHMFGLCISVEL